MTGRELVSASLRLIGALAAGETAEAQEAVDALATINRMIDSWSNEKLLIFAHVTETFSFVVGTAAYTMGTGGTFNTSRPQWIEDMTLRDSTTTPAVEFQIRMLSDEEYANIPVKDLRSSYPYSVYDDGGYPLRTLKFYPVPGAAHSVKIVSAKPLTQIATLNTSISLPPGFERALVFNAAMDLAPEYGKAMKQDILAIAMDSKANLKRAQYKPDYLRVDDDIRAIPNRFNIYTGLSR